MMRRLSGKRDEDAVDNVDDEGKDVSDFGKVGENKLVSEKAVEKFDWNPLNYIKKSSDAGVENKTEQRDSIVMKGRIILYTKLGCQESNEIRLFLRLKRLRYVEINIDVFPGRKKELERISGSTSVPKVFFNEILIGGSSELKTLDESGKLDEKVDFLITEAPLFEAPSPPLSGEDDVPSSGLPDELAIIVRKMKESIVVKDRLHKVRRFTNCFLGSEAIDFLSEDQYLERPESRLSDSAADAVKNLLPKYAQNDLGSVCSWADRVRFYLHWSSALHFADTPDKLCNYQYDRDCKDQDGEKGRCVVGAIKNYTDQLLDYGKDTQYNLTQALLFLSHFMGDVHQPLHVGFTSDKEGNLINIH